MPRDYRRRAKLKAQQSAVDAWPDIFLSSSDSDVDDEHGAYTSTLDAHLGRSTTRGPRSIECSAGDRTASAHIRRFESATEAAVLRAWGADATTSSIVRDWDNFILGQLLEATTDRATLETLERERRQQQRHQQSPTTTRVEDHTRTGATAAKWNTSISGVAVKGATNIVEQHREACEVCLRGTARRFAETLRVTKVSSDSAASTPLASRCASPTPDKSREVAPDEMLPVTESQRGRAETRHGASSTGSARQLSRPLRIWALDTLDLRIYVTSAYIHLLRASPASICTTTPATYTSLYLSFHPSEQSPFPPGSNPAQHLSVYTLLLASDSQSLLTTENAGGSSVESEVLSFEVLRRIMPYWELSTMEMSTAYSSSGPIADYVARSHIDPRQEVSVSVTRVFGWNSSMKISRRQLAPLLVRKLAGLRSATQRILPRRRRGMVLFIWVPDGTTEKHVHRVWAKLREAAERCTATHAHATTATAYGVPFETDITEGVVVFVGVCRKESWMDLHGWRRVFGKRDEVEDAYLPFGPQNSRRADAEREQAFVPTPPATPKLAPVRVCGSGKGGPQRRQSAADADSRRLPSEPQTVRRNTIDPSISSKDATVALAHNGEKPPSQTSGSAKRRRWRKMRDCPGETPVPSS